MAMTTAARRGSAASRAPLVAILRGVSNSSCSGAGAQQPARRGTEGMPPKAEGGGKPLNLFSAINQALHIALDTDPRKTHSKNLSNVGSPVNVIGK